MHDDLQKLNQSATQLLPGDFSKTSNDGLELCYFAIPDFTDAVQLGSETANEVCHETPTRDLKRQLQSPEMTPNELNQSDETSATGPAIPAYSFSPSINPEEAVRVGLQQRISEIRVSCDPLVKCISQRIETGQAGLFVFCDVDTPLRSGQACLAVARELAVATGKKILVIDCDLETSSLTRRLGLEARAGTREMLRAMNGWQRLVVESDVENVVFMPCGTQKLRFTEPSSFVEGVIRKAVGEISGEFAAILVTTGSAFDNGIHAWRGLCSGTFLVLDSELSSRSVSKAAVRELNATGCRVLGCLPTYRPGKTGATTRRAS